MKRHMLIALPAAAALATVLGVAPAAFAAGATAAPHTSVASAANVRPAVDCDPDSAIHAAICLPQDIPDGTYDLTGQSGGYYFYYNASKSYLLSTPIYMGQSFTRVSA